MNVLSEGWIKPPPSGVGIGVFDGVHRGHAQVISRLVDRAHKAGLQAGILTFDPHPVEVLAPQYAPSLLTTVERRIELLEGLGVDWVGSLNLAEIRMMSPEEFVTGVLLDRASTRLVSVGDDFRFGRDRVGDVSVLRDAGAVNGFDVAAVELLHDSDGVISSTRIRSLIADGDVAGAAALLGRPHRIGGPVIRGDARGRTLGFPTANIALPARLAVPPDGIYAVRLSGGVEADGVASLGVRPTFEDGGQRLLEVFVFDFSGDLYGAKLEVDFIERLRGEEKFDSVEALVTQMNADVAAARRLLAEVQSSGM